MTPLIAGNWKMNGSRAALAELDAIAAAAAATPGVEVAICPPFTLIERAVARQPGLLIGGQDCHAEPHGAFTGAVSAAMLAEAGARLAIVGHSERRRDQHETDAMVCAKAEAAMGAGLMTIICVGETEAARADGGTEAMVARQLRGSVPHSAGDHLVIAYEPIWAIGSGQTPTVEEVAGVHALIRRSLAGLLGETRAAMVRILYGGSVNAHNAAALLAAPHVDGALVGSASLTAADFVPIIEAAA
ncbi:triose-phosphate isomerase [Sphingomonas morindae]|uniref:Triosephosphate isomerase n=1 Tax=Sphingomonas morindae TaxID=1541170 RepID=A0ABY4X4J7_9SPHN|nr:triose-phosphate isomerase [Sphingomonas morindae]USI71780.1 triose-phosphate isomerase [Sphingomonas morindae]